jgi:preprotein translocase subunit SecG
MAKAKEAVVVVVVGVVVGVVVVGLVLYSRRGKRGKMNGSVGGHKTKKRRD